MEKSVVFTAAKATSVSFENAWRHGQFFFIATLKDGRDIGFSADKVVITDNGDLIAISTTFYSEETGKRAPVENPKTVIALARGEWVSYYSANVISGDPIAIDWFEGEGTGK